MSVIKKKLANLMTKKSRNTNSQYKVNSWAKKFIHFYTGPDDEETLGLGGEASDVEIMKTAANGGIIPQALFTDDIISMFLAHTWAIILKKSHQTEPGIRAIKYYLSQNAKEHKLAKDSIMELIKDFSETISLFKKIEATKEYVSYEGESAIRFEEDDIEKIKKINVFDAKNAVDRDLLNDRIISAALIETNIRGENMWGLKEEDVLIFDINEKKKSKPKQMAVRFKLQGGNKEKHKKCATTYFLGCYCEVHIYMDPKCDVGAFELYQYTKVEDDKKYVQKSRSSKKKMDWATLKYIRRPLYEDSDPQKENYYSRNGKSKENIVATGARLDKMLGLSVENGTNQDLKDKKRRKKITCHSFRNTGTTMVENELGDEEVVTKDVKMRLTGHTTGKLYTQYCGDAEKQSAINLRRKLMNKNKNKKKDDDKAVHPPQKQQVLPPEIPVLNLSVPSMPPPPNKLNALNTLNALNKNELQSHRGYGHGQMINYNAFVAQHRSPPPTVYPFDAYRSPPRSTRFGPMNPPRSTRFGPINSPITPINSNCGRVMDGFPPVNQYQYPIPISHYHQLSSPNVPPYQSSHGYGYRYHDRYWAPY